MASSKGYLDFILDQLSALNGISYRQMMGEYILYYQGKIAAYICDDRLLVKPVPSAVALMKQPVWERPYEAAKEMLLVEEVDDRAFLTELFEAMLNELPDPPKKKKKAKDL